MEQRRGRGKASAATGGEGRKTSTVERRRGGVLEVAEAVVAAVLLPLFGRHPKSASLPKVGWAPGREGRRQRCVQFRPALGLGTEEKGRGGGRLKWGEVPYRAPWGRKKKKRGEDFASRKVFFPLAAQCPLSSPSALPQARERGRGEGGGGEIRKFSLSSSRTFNSIFFLLLFLPPPRGVGPRVF